MVITDIDWWEFFNSGNISWAWSPSSIVNYQKSGVIFWQKPSPKHPQLISWYFFFLSKKFQNKRKNCLRTLKCLIVLSSSWHQMEKANILMCVQITQYDGYVKHQIVSFMLVLIFFLSSMWPSEAEQEGKCSPGD